MKFIDCWEYAIYIDRKTNEMEPYRTEFYRIISTLEPTTGWAAIFKLLDLNGAIKIGQCSAHPAKVLDPQGMLIR